MIFTLGILSHSERTRLSTPKVEALYNNNFRLETDLPPTHLKSLWGWCAGPGLSLNLGGTLSHSLTRDWGTGTQRGKKQASQGQARWAAETGSVPRDSSWTTLSLSIVFLTNLSSVSKTVQLRLPLTSDPSLSQPVPDSAKPHAGLTWKNRQEASTEQAVVPWKLRQLNSFSWMLLSPLLFHVYHLTILNNMEYSLSSLFLKNAFDFSYF